jgi:hypothetical protein
MICLKQGTMIIDLLVQENEKTKTEHLATMGLSDAL